MDYDREILHVLAEAGAKGLSLRKITTHVYNRVNGLFSTVSIGDVHRYVASYVIRTVRQKGSVIEHASGHGVYRISESCHDSSQLEFNFKSYSDESKEEEPPNEDKSLLLF